MSSESDFKIVRPVAITDAILTSTNVPETVAATYAGGTTYTTGNRTGLAPVYGDAQLIYESKTSGNIGNPLPVPPATSTTHWKYVGSVYPVYNSGSSCGIGGIVSSISTDVHSLYYSLVAANTGNPLTDITKWQPIGSTNARAMFDEVYGSQTEAPEAINTVVTAGVLTNTVFLGNLEATAVTITQSISGYAETRNLNSHPVLNWYDWYYEPLIRATDALFVNIPPYAASNLTIEITNLGGTAKCGLCIIGQSVTLGKTQWELIGEIISYSGTTTDTFGNTTFLPRAKVKKLNLEVRIPAGFETEAHRLLTLYTDVPTVFIGSSLYGMTWDYGYLGNWSVPISITGRNAPIEIRGLT